MSKVGDEMKQGVKTTLSGGVGSRANLSEAKNVVTLAIAIAEAVGEETVAVLSWYNNQVALVTHMLRERGYTRIHVGTISTAQGSEWDYVVLSAVRTHRSEGGLGILSDANILNVALTRAKYGLVIIGDCRALGGDTNWKALI